MLKKLLLLFIVFTLQGVNGFGSEIVPLSFHSTELSRTWQHLVYLPDKYSAALNPLPVLYLLHGNGGSERSWSHNGQLKKLVDTMISKGLIKPLVIVMPEANITWYVNGAENMESAIIEELIPKVEKTY